MTSRRKLAKILGRYTHRTQIINLLLQSFGHKHTRYLEIGVRRGETIVRISATEKIGVDPALQLHNIDSRYASKLNSDKITWHETTSDNFFQSNQLTYDVIFVDGLHLYEQAVKDILNALNTINPYGVVVVHDCNPLTKKAAARTQGTGVWNGDVWKTIVDLNENFSQKVSIVTLDTDFGIALITKVDPHTVFPVRSKTKYQKLEYDWFANNRQQIINLQPSHYIFEFLMKRQKHTFMPSNYISGIVAVSDHETMDEIPYQESLLSSLHLVDDLYVVYGGSTRSDKRTPVKEWLINQAKEKPFTVLEFPWPKSFNWTQFSLSYGYAKSYVTSPWSMFFTCDELFPKSIGIIKKLLPLVPNFVHYIALIRMFVVDSKKASPYIRKRMIFRNLPQITFGIISALSPQKDNPIDFGRLVNIDKWYDSGGYLPINQDMSPTSVILKQRQGILLKGYRDHTWYRTLNLPFSYYNTHSLFLSPNNLERALTRSYKAYTRLPSSHRLDIDPKNAVTDYKKKLKNQRSGRCWPIPREVRNMINQYHLSI